MHMTFEDKQNGIHSAPMPTKQTLKLRQNILFQLWRFISLNFRMVKMIVKSDH
jgi:hypothetical protein